MRFILHRQAARDAVCGTPGSNEQGADISSTGSRNQTIWLHALPLSLSPCFFFLCSVLVWFFIAHLPASSWPDRRSLSSISMTSVRQRPTLWSYLSFQKTAAATRHDRSSSIASQCRPDDPHEKPERFSDPPAGEGFPAMSNRWVRTVVAMVLFCVALFFLSPKNSITKTESYLAGVCLTQSLSFSLFFIFFFSFSIPPSSFLPFK